MSVNELQTGRDCDEGSFKTVIALALIAFVIALFIVWVKK